MRDFCFKGRLEPSESCCPAGELKPRRNVVCVLPKQWPVEAWKASITSPSSRHSNSSSSHDFKWNQARFYFCFYFLHLAASVVKKKKNPTVDILYLALKHACLLSWPVVVYFLPFSHITVDYWPLDVGSINNHKPVWEAERRGFYVTEQGTLESATAPAWGKHHAGRWHLERKPLHIVTRHKTAFLCFFNLRFYTTECGNNAPYFRSFGVARAA